MADLTSPQRTGNVSIVRRMSMETYMVRIYTGPLSQDYEFTSIEAEKMTTAEEIVKAACKKLILHPSMDFELAEVFMSSGHLCKERRLEGSENPVRVQLLWPKIINMEYDSVRGLVTGYRFYIRRKDLENSKRTSSWLEYQDPNPVDNFLTNFLVPPTNNKEYPDLCNLPDLNEKTLLQNIKARFYNSNIYTYVGSILIAVNPFRFFPIYNPKYVTMYHNRRLGDLPPHIFAVADSAFHTMLRKKKNQCIVISGESGSGKTESTNLLLHHLTALSQKGLHGSGVEQTILGAGPVLEAFGNAKTVHNNNSSRFGKFIQVNYKENGMVHGAIVEKYLLEKSRIVSQAKNERNYHVFYYLLAGADDLERQKLHLGAPSDYYYLNQSDCFTLEEVDEENEFSRLKQSMELVGFSVVTQKRIFGVLSAVLHLGNVQFRKRGDQTHDESVSITNHEVIKKLSDVLKVKEKTLCEALTQKKATAGDETVVMKYKMEDAVATRDAMAKCLYGALFDWIVLKVNQALLAKRHNSEHQGNSIGVLDIFGFEDFSKNSFEQFCINYANEHLQYYFNQHIFKFEQEEYKKEGIQWKNIEFIDNTGCLEIFSRRPNGLFSLLDEECNFPGASNDTLLSKFHYHHGKGNIYYEAPQKRERGFAILHYAGKVKYEIDDFREKNSDLMRPDIVGNLKSSSLAFVRELMGVDPVAVLRWAILKTLLKAVFAFIKAGERYRNRGGPDLNRRRRHSQLTGDYLTIPDLLSSDNFLRKRRSNPRFSEFDEYPRARSPKYTSSSSSSSLHVSNASACASAMGDTGCGDVDDVFLRSPCHSGQRSPVESILSEDEARVMRKANRVIMKNKSFKSRIRPNTMFNDIKTLKAIASRSMFGGSTKMSNKKQPPSVSAQFQWSLARLMNNLNQANPFFIRCIKSNADKLPCTFDEVLVLRQLRYTGMLATVRIRQSGYNYRLTFEEFAHMYKILLPKGLASTKEEVCFFLEKMDLNTENYQIGITKVFLRENEKQLLDEALHCVILKRVITIQRWIKSKLERKNFLQLRESAITIQQMLRQYLVQKHFNLKRESLLIIQKWFRGASVRRKYLHVRNTVIKLQSRIRGYQERKRFLVMLEERHKMEAEMLQLKQEDIQSSTSDEGVLMKGSSAEELDKEYLKLPRRDSEESSGILGDSESDTVSERGASVSTPPPTPTSPGFNKDEFMKNTGQSVRNQEHVNFHSSPVLPPADATSPTTDSMSLTIPLTSDQLKLIEEAVNRGPRRSLDNQHGQDRKSPLKSVKKKVNKMMHGTTRRKKDSSESDDEPQLHNQNKRPQILGVQVLPVSTTDQSPKSPTASEILLSGDEASLGEGKSPSKKQRQLSRKEQSSEKKTVLPPQGNWNVAKTSQWQYPENWVINDFQELQQLDDFLYKKVMELSKDCGKRDSVFDVVFKKALKEFHKELTLLLSVWMQVGGNIKYRDLMANYETTLHAQIQEEKTNALFPETLGINAFRGFLDEFMKLKKEKKLEKKPYRPNKREKKSKDIIEYSGHKFSQVQFGIPTFCELCSKTIWILEKGHVCQVCRYTCHKKCLNKSTTPCKSAQDSQKFPAKYVFGAQLACLMKDNQKCPLFMEKLIQALELHGLYTEGIYRKSGAASKVKLLKQEIDNGKTDFDVNEYSVHVLATTLKCFVRELQEPLLTFEYYDEFLRVSEIKDEKESVQCLFSVIEKLPKPNHDVLERLIFHLAKVASHEAHNKMSVGGLAIIFAPCLLRTNKKLQAQESLNQVSRQTLCIEKVLKFQLQKLMISLQDIDALENAELTAIDRLSAFRASMRNAKNVDQAAREKHFVKRDEDDHGDLMDGTEDEEIVLSEHIISIRKEKVDLTSNLPVLEYRHSSDDEMLSTDDLDSNEDITDDLDEREEYAVDFSLPVIPSSGLNHLTKGRCPIPQKRLPELYCSAKSKQAKDSPTDSSTDLCDQNAKTVVNSSPKFSTSSPVADHSVMSKSSASSDSFRELSDSSNMERYPSLESNSYSLFTLEDDVDEIIV
ncbi:hypothetical protein CHS0354_036814 [Potamilus streckersoni]|uniref:Unconventional myosin-IXb n=1 Tax=Potamilus streckersoni TaxID=2493646 RepID=A0AAE0SJ84_9BIVA|nr:hypothetical protein CHS0354_036814 [Potamilus streckersoni]